MISGVKRNKFLTLVKKEILADKYLNIIIATLILAANIIIIAVKPQPDQNDSGNWYIAASILSFFVLSSFWVFLVAIRSMTKEWELNTSYLIISLPISGIKLLSSKIASILFMYTIFAIEGSIMSLIIAFIKNIFINFHFKFNELPLIFANLLLLYIYVLVVLTFFIVLFQMAFIISRLVNRFAKILTVISVFSLLWIFMKASTYLSKLVDLIGLPDIKLFVAEAGAFPPINISPIIAGVVIIAMFFYLTAKLFDNVVEV